MTSSSASPPTDPGALREEALGRLEAMLQWLSERASSCRGRAVYRRDDVEAFERVAKQYDQRAADLRLLLAHVASLRSALEPFAKALDVAESEQEHPGMIRLAAMGELQLPDFRAAMTALSSQQDKPNEQV